MKKNNYSAVHINSVSLLGLMMGVIVSKKNSVKNIIVHSHNDGLMTIKYRLVKVVSDYILKKYANYFFACSERAAMWKFPRNVIEGKKYKVIKNGIDTEKFKFDTKIREEYREQLRIQKKFVLGHVGRFEEQKNHEFIINVFQEVLKINKNAVLILIGEGNLKERIENIAKEKKIQENIMFLGIRDDVNYILQAMDVFVFPSIFEGLGIAVIEAECSGLPVICSDKLPKEVEITDRVHKISLAKGAEKWADKILKVKDKSNREIYYKEINCNGYDIKEVANKMEEFYLKLI